ncbi:ABC transporter permease [Herbinix luporum]|uniref:ABC transporter permease n=1 Tax=Herbinix luporum TaxID=1679721 RepID=UPI0023F0F2A1|nr:ABC transporter permease [Herbinix luporum]
MLLFKCYFKRKSTLCIILLIFIANYMTFIGIRSLLSTYQGYCEMSSLVHEGTYIANLNPKNDYSFANITESDVQQIFNYLDRNFDFALYIDGNLITLPDCDIEVSVNYLNEEYYKLFPLELEQGIKLSFDYKLNDDEIPVLIGTGLSKTYPLGSTISISDPAMGRNITLKVVGILKKNAFHSNYYMPNWKNYYNFSIFVPVNQIFIENANVDFHINSIMNLIVLHTTVEKTETLSDILLENLGLQFKFYSQQENYEHFENDYLKSIIIQFISALVLYAITIWIANRNILKGNRLLLNNLSSSISENVNSVKIRKSGYIYLKLIFLLGLLGVFIFTAYERFSYWVKKDTLVAAYGFLGLTDIDWGSWLTVLFIDMLIGVLIVETASKHFLNLFSKQEY